MRLIDADALTDFLKCLLPSRGMWEIEGDPAKDAICETVADAIEMVKNMETIKPRPRGKWIEVNDAYNRISGRCSACGWEAHMYEDDVVGMPFCPSCGADMREGEEQE